MARYPAKSFISKQVRRGEYYFLEMDADQSANIAVVCGGKEVCGSNYQIDRSGFQYQCLEFVSKGAGILSIKGQKFPLRPGTFFFYGPGIPHSIGVDSDSNMVKYFVDFVGSKPKDLLKDTPLSQFEPMQIAESAPLLEIYELLHRAAKPQRSHSRQICALLLEMLILRAKELAIPREAMNSLSWATYQACFKYIESYFLKLKELSEVAMACDISKEYLCRVFKRYHACSPYQFLTQLKMVHAASLLVQPGHLIKEIAAAVGFDDAYHFSKTFKGVYGLSPEQFRRQRHRR